MASKWKSLKLRLLILFGSIGSVLWGQQPMAGVEFSQLSGFYEAPFTVELSAVEGARIYYTLDGNKPTPRSLRYTRPVLIEKSTAIRASRLFRR